MPRNDRSALAPRSHFSPKVKTSFTYSWPVRQPADLFDYKPRLQQHHGVHSRRHVKGERFAFIMALPLPGFPIVSVAAGTDFRLCLTSQPSLTI
jgi:hypothetical protein